MASMRDRRSGILLHPTSLPGPHGAGDLGPAAHRFVDWLASARQRLWQVLPLGPT
ncbi:MAG TPA: 4-alpha-glucanotransferase, partial [Anaeromyxobacter sp.]|nr:4-alpha-glucanotransferase [Anaeromyxobacter sp.]